MEYITDEQGQIKIMDDKGNVKWLPKLLVENKQLMTRNKFTIVPKPQIFESEQAEASEAKKRGRPSLNK